MKDQTAKVVEHRSNDVRVVVAGRDLKKYTERERAVSYARGWNQFDRHKNQRPKS